jgi:linearmycin/streptolysin S transport system permease protein
MNVRRARLAVSQITRTELKRYLQDRIAIFTTVLMPVILIVLIGSAVGSAPTELVLGVIDADGSATSQQLVADLDSAGALKVVAYDDERTLRRDIRLSQLSAGLLVPADLAARVDAGSTVDLTVLTVQADASAASVIAAVNGAVADAGGRLAATRFVVGQTGLPVADASEAVERYAKSLPASQVSVTTVGTVRQEDDNAFTRAVTSQLTLFVFANGLFAAAALVETRRLGVSRRAMSTPIGPGTLLVGIGGSRFALALLQAALLLLVGAFGFGVSWGSLPATTAIVVAYALVATGAGMLLGAAARTADQAIAVAVPLAIGTAMLGGTMWPLEAVGPVMRTVGHLMPQSWAMDAWSAVVNDGAGVADVARELAVLTGYAAVLLVAGTWALRRTLTR